MPEQYWVKVIRERRDRYRTELTDKAVLDAVGACEGLRVLDAGCGEGYLARTLADRGADVTGVDVSQGLIDAASATPRRRTRPRSCAPASTTCRSTTTPSTSSSATTSSATCTTRREP